MSKLTHRRTKKVSKFEKIKDVALKMNENEKRKSDAKKKEKQKKPKGYRARKAGVVTFWVMLVLMFLIVVVNSGGGKKQTEAMVLNEPTTSKAVSTEAVEFSKDFLSKYFTWNLDKLDQNDRDATLSYFVSKDIVDQIGRITGKTWHSTLKRDAVLLKEAQDLGDNKSILTYQVNITYDKTLAAIEKEKSALGENGEDTYSVENLSPDSMDVVVNEQGIVKRIIKKKFVTIHLYYDADQNRFVIYQIPSFTYFEDTPNTSGPEMETDNLRTVVGNETNAVKDFLNTFFEAYANDSSEKLSYLFDDERRQSGLNKTMEFVTVKNVTVYEGRNEKEKVVSATVIFAEPDTGIEYSSNYQIVVAEKQDRFVVKHLNSKKYIDDMLNDAEQTADKTDVDSSEDNKKGDEVEKEQEEQSTEE
ncbi:conjugal transfer protein [Heyndrickxia sporothermodurans]|uniref:conjugal transfer protein n=1 Tax=Heyndrickxia sporothermodurans TaxID=46224 RepID=UPI002DBE5559|nr:conjugal transfer protein [Heyndrickxia sporothermodurans]MEB6549282.1 conjugal transfer protein [Heyndrickxia sporothermodurans]